MKIMRVLFLAASLTAAFAATCTNTSTTTGKWVGAVSTARSAARSATATDKCWERDWCSAKSAARCSVTANCGTNGTTTCTESTAASMCTTYGTCYQKDTAGVSTHLNQPRCPSVAVKTVTDVTLNTKALCEASTVTYTATEPTGGTAAQTGGVWVANTWIAGTATLSTYKGDDTDFAAATHTETEWTAVKTAGVTGVCGCWDSLSATLVPPANLAPVTDCKDDLGHSHSRYCNTAGSTFSTSMVYVQPNKAGTASGTYVSKTGTNVNSAGTKPDFLTNLTAVCSGSTLTAAAAAWTQTTISAKDWKEDWTVSSTGVCAAAPAGGAASPAAALSGIAAIFFAIMAML